MANSIFLFYSHQDVGKCMPGQSLRISVEDAARYLSQVYENDFEVLPQIYSIRWYYVVMFGN